MKKGQSFCFYSLERFDDIFYRNFLSILYDRIQLLSRFLIKIDTIERVHKIKICRFSIRNHLSKNFTDGLAY